MPYKYAVYNMQDQSHSDASNAAMAALEAEGWRPHTVNCNYAELCVFWVRDAPGDDTFDGAKDTSVAGSSQSSQGGSAGSQAGQS